MSPVTKQPYNPRYQAPALGGNTILGKFATPGYESPYTQAGHVKFGAMHQGSASNRALQGLSRPLQGGWESASMGGRGGRISGYGGSQSGAGTFRDGSGQRVMYDGSQVRPANLGRINARAGISSATGGGLSTHYLRNALPGRHELLQARMRRDQSLSPEQMAPDPVNTSLPSNWTGDDLKKIQDGIKWRANGGPVKGVQPYIVGDGAGEEMFIPSDKGKSPYLVGQEGAEIFIPESPGRILSTEQTRSRMSRMGLPVHRQNGGPVYPLTSMSADQIPINSPIFRQGGGYVSPYAIQYARGRTISRSFPDGGDDNQVYQDLYNKARSLGIDMANAPTTTSGLRRYVAMGRRAQDVARTAQRAVRQVQAKQLEEEAKSLNTPKSVVPRQGGGYTLDVGGRRVGESTFGQPRTQPGRFANRAGEYFPMGSSRVSRQIPGGDGWGTETWQQANALDNAQAASGGSIPEGRYTIEDVERLLNSL